MEHISIQIAGTLRHNIYVSEVDIFWQLEIFFPKLKPRYIVFVIFSKLDVIFNVISNKYI